MPLVISGAVSGSTTLQATDAVTATITLPSATGTVQLANSALNGSLGATTPSTVVATTGVFTKATAGDALTITNGGATPQPLYVYSGTSIAAILTGATGAGGGIVFTSSQVYLQSPDQSKSALITNAGLSVTTTIGVGNATPSTSGAGITFPATQSASTDANTLDDYEEGTWTPTIAGSSTPGTGTYSVQSGTYTKIGNTVRVTANLTWTGHTGVGQITVAGYPFTSTAEISPLSFSYYGTSLVLVGPLFQAYKNGSSTDSGTAQTSATGGFTAVGIVAAGTYYVSGVYKVA